MKPHLFILAVVAISTALSVAADKENGAADLKAAFESLRFTVSDKQEDADQTIATIKTVFVTNDDDKDKNDGISESYMRGQEVLGRNTSWGKDLNFRDHSTNLGQEFDISSYKIAAKNVGSIVYNWNMDNDDGWNVQMNVYIKLANGHEYQVGGHYWNIHGGAKNGSIGLGW